MSEINIKDSVFESAIENGSYSRTKLVDSINQIIAPEKLNDTDDTILGSVLLSINDNGKKDLSLLQLVTEIEKNKTNAAKSLVNKIYSNQSIKSQFEAFKAERQKDHNKWYLMVFGLAALVLFIGAYKFGYIKSPLPIANEGAKVVVLDTARLAYSATAPYMNAEVSLDQAQKISLQYRDKLQKEIQKYVDNGYIIINRSNVYVTSESNDITDKLIKDLGLKPVDRERFDADYTNQQKYDVLKNFAQLNVGDYESAAINDANASFNAQAEQQLNNSEVITNAEGQSIDIE